MPISTFLLASLATTSLASVIHMPINKHAAPIARGLAPRQPATEANLKMTGTTRFQFQIGTPPQDVLWGIDTGSFLPVLSDVASGSVCENAGDPGCYDHTKSSTFQQTQGNCGEGFLGGGIGSDAAVNGTDTFILGDITVDNVWFCYNTKATGVPGIMGLAMSNSEMPPLLSGLRDGHIDRAAIAIWLNDLGKDDGEITFGGVDPARAIGGFTKMDWHAEVDGSYSNLRAPFTSFGLIDADGHSHSLTPQNYPGRAPALDTGDPGISLPVDMYNALWSALGVVNSTSTNLKAVPCDLRDSSAKLTFEFGGSLVVETPMSLWVGRQFDEPIFLPNGTAVPACQLAIDADDGDNGLLGQPLIQYLYNVWDYENKDLYMAVASQGAPAPAAPTPLTSGTGIPGVTATATATGSVVTTGQVVQTEPQRTTAVGGTTGLVYSTPAYPLGAGNPEPTGDAAVIAAQPTTSPSGPPALGAPTSKPFTTSPSTIVGAPISQTPSAKSIPGSWESWGSWTSSTTKTLQSSSTTTIPKSSTTTTPGSWGSWGSWTTSRISTTTTVPSSSTTHHTSSSSGSWESWGSWTTSSTTKTVQSSSSTSSTTTIPSSSSTHSTASTPSSWGTWGSWTTSSTTTSSIPISTPSTWGTWGSWTTSSSSSTTVPSSSTSHYTTGTPSSWELWTTSSSIKTVQTSSSSTTTIPNTSSASSSWGLWTTSSTTSKPIRSSSSSTSSSWGVWTTSSSIVTTTSTPSSWGLWTTSSTTSKPIQSSSSSTSSSWGLWTTGSSTTTTTTIPSTSSVTTHYTSSTPSSWGVWTTSSTTSKPIQSSSSSTTAIPSTSRTSSSWGLWTTSSTTASIPSTTSSIPISTPSTWETWGSWTTSTLKTVVSSSTTTTAASTAWQTY